MKRRYTFTRRCVAEGCKESIHYELDTRKELAAMEFQYRNVPYVCSRHRPENLQPNSDEREIEVTCKDGSELATLAGKHYWSNGSGFIYGPGFNAYADDFLIGTKIRFRISVELPNPTDDRMVST